MLLVKNKLLRQIAGSLETANLLTLKLLLRNRRNWHRFAGKAFRDYMSLVGQDRWRSVPIEDIIPGGSGIRISLEHMDGAGIYAQLDEAAYLALIASYLRPRHIFEIGTFRGRTTLNFAINSPPECRIYTLDLPLQDRVFAQSAAHRADALIMEKSVTGIDYRSRPERSKIEQLFGNSLTFDFAPYYGRMDLVFVDGAHHYDAVISDTTQALKMLAPGGVVLWHDFANYGDYNDVTRAILKLVPGDRLVQISNSQIALYQPGNDLAQPCLTIPRAEALSPGEWGGAV